MMCLSRQEQLTQDFPTGSEKIFSIQDFLSFNDRKSSKYNICLHVQCELGVFQRQVGIINAAPKSA